MENIDLSWIVVFIGIILLIIPIIISGNRDDEKLADRKMSLLYYAIAGIVIMVLGVLLVLSFSDKLPYLIT